MAVKLWTFSISHKHELVAVIVNDFLADRKLVLLNFWQRPLHAHHPKFLVCLAEQADQFSSRITKIDELLV